MLIAQARKSGTVRYVGRGANVWSNVHIDDVVDHVYRCTGQSTQWGSFYFVENGEGSLAEIAQAIAHSLGQSKKRPRSENTSTPPIPSARRAGSEPSAPGPSWVGNRGSPDLGPELQKKIVDGVLEEVDGRSFEELSQERDTLIMGLLELLSHRGMAKPMAARGHTADDS